MAKNEMTAEQRRLTEAYKGTPWKKWGPYLSERQWGTVREDYSENGDAWNYFTHDQSRSRAYRSGEDGLAGFSDEKQRLCFALALSRIVSSASSSATRTGGSRCTEAWKSSRRTPTGGTTSFSTSTSTGTTGPGSAQATRRAGRALWRRSSSSSEASTP